VLRFVFPMCISLLSGCALLVNGGRTQSVLVTTDPPGAELEYDGRAFLTPALLNMSRHGATVEVYKHGFAPAKATFDTRPATLLLFLDIIPCGNPIALIIDIAYGAQNTLVPSTQHVVLTAVSAEEAANLSAKREAERKQRQEEIKREKKRQEEIEARRRAARGR